MRMLRLIIAATLVGGSLVYVAIGEHKAIGIVIGAASLLLTRFMIPNLGGAPKPDASDEPANEKPAGR